MLHSAGRVYKILIVDDLPENLYAIEHLLCSLSHVETYCACGGDEALKLSLVHEFCLAIVDVQMPGMDGYELVELLRSNQLTKQLPVIFVSGVFSDEYHYRKGYEVGAVDFIAKPFMPEILLSKVQVFINLYDQRLQLERWNHLLEDMVFQRTEELSRAYDTTLEGWAKALELRERETAGHSRRVVMLTLRMAETIGIPAEERVHIHRGALLHDIGKMGVPDSILHKPGPLTPEEWQIMRQHPVFAYQLLHNITFLRRALDIPYCHHERWDGTGYPRGLSGEDIPIAARIFTIVDVWDALNSDRPYRGALARGDVVKYVAEEAGRCFDPSLVEVFLGLMQRDGDT
ncbi:MAG: HD domain-containing phosphohydrolase [Chloroflexota bacterium]